MLQIEIFRPKDVPLRDREAWQLYRKVTPAFHSPLLGPDFAEAVAEVREDAAVAIWRRAGQPVDFLAHHRRPAGLARPIGSPWSDYQALITAPGESFDVVEALRGAGVSSFRFSGLIDPYGHFAAASAETAETYRMVVHDSGEAYWETLRAASPKRFKNLRRLEHKVERELGPAAFGKDEDEAAFRQVLAWKREQFQRTGLHDVLGPDWSRQLMQRLFERRQGEFQGLFLSLRIGGEVAAGHFGVREGENYHPWIAAFDPAHSAYSPGQIFLSEAVRAMPRLGLVTYDLSAGADHYKKPFASEIGMAASGVLRTRPAGPFSFDRAAELAGATLGRTGAVAVRRLGRRLDHILETELSLGGRMQGVATAIAASSRRLAVSEEH
jgi:CelD/BcsL family acetyltransferase involved in cellulose biosynthesis